MNSIREINRINQRELELGIKGSWHDEYRDSAYIFVGGLSFDLTEGDVITVFSQFGEIADINLPRDKVTGKTKGFGFVMYEDQRSTVLAVDNMNGAQVVGRTIRVDHCRGYKQPNQKNDDGEWVPPDQPTYNALPPMIEDANDSDSSVSEAGGDSLDDEDPMAAYLRAEKKKEKKEKARLEGGEGKKKRKQREGETKEERRARKEAKRAKKGKQMRIKDEPVASREKEKLREVDAGGRSKSGGVEGGGRGSASAGGSANGRLRDEGDGDRRNGRADRDDWRTGRWELERDEPERERERGRNSELERNTGERSSYRSGKDDWRSRDDREGREDSRRRQDSPSRKRSRSREEHYKKGDQDRRLDRDRDRARGNRQ